MQQARNVFSLLIVALMLGACATADKPSQQVFAIHQSYDLALTGAVAYRQLPPCATPAVQPCRDPVVLEQIRKADLVAKPAMDAAQSAVRTPSFGEDVAQSAITAARAAMTALQAIIAQFYPQALKGAK